ncbi:MAG: fibronectin type III domain-containing protein [bacterium]
MNASTNITLTLTATDNHNASATASVEVTVLPPPSVVTLSLSPTSVSEGDGATTITVTATIAPTSSVFLTERTLTLSIGDATGGGAATEGADYATIGEVQLTLPARAANATTTFTLTPTDDDIAEGDETIAVALPSPPDGVTADAATLTLADNDTAGVTIITDPASNPPTIALVEDGDGNSATYTVMLNTQPSGEVIVTPSADSGDIAVEIVSAAPDPPDALMFDADNWDRPQRVRVTAVNDDIVNNPARAATITHAVAGADYDAVVAADLTVTLADDDTAGVTIATDPTSNPPALTLAEAGDDNSATYTVALNTQPSGEVIVTATSGDTSVARTNGAESTAARTLTFTAAGWNEPQTVTIIAVNDDLDSERGATITHTVASTADADYDGIVAASVAVALIDDDAAPGMPTGLMADAESSVELSASWVEPADANPAVTGYSVQYRQGRDGDYTGVTFFGVGTMASITGLRADTEYQVRVAAMNAVGPGPYARASANTYDMHGALAFTDVDAATRAVAENAAGGANVGAALAAASNPDSGVALIFSEESGGDGGALFDVSADGQITVANGAELDFEAVASYTLVVGVRDNLINVPGAMNGDADSAVDDTIVVTISVTDVNEAPSFDDGDATMRAVAENAAGGANVGAALAASDPDGDALRFFEQSGGDGGALFDVSAGGQITVTNGAVLDFEAVASYTLIVGVRDNSINIPGATNGDADSVVDDTIAVTIDITDVNEDPTLSIVGVTTVAESNQLTLTLNGADAETDANQLTYADDADFGAISGNTFTWTPDFGDAGLHPITFTVTDADGNTATAATTIAVTAATRAPTRIALSLDPASVREGDGATTIAVTATLAPSGNVFSDARTLTLSVGGASGDGAAIEGADFAAVGDVRLTIPARASNATATFTFTPTDDDFAEDDETIAVAMTSPPDDVTADAATLTLVDNDAAGITIATDPASDPPTIALAENGGGNRASYAVALASHPTDDVIVTPSVLGAGGLFALAGAERNAVAALTFTDADGNALDALIFAADDWRTPQRVIVTAVDDDLDNRDNERDAIIAHSVVSADANYDNFAAASVGVSVADDDDAGVIISATSLTLDEDGGAGAYTIALRSEPFGGDLAGEVTVGLASDGDGTEIEFGAESREGKTLTFTADDWDRPQRVEVIGVDDDIVNDIERVATITHQVAGADYDAVAAGEVRVTLTDDDAIGVRIGAASLTLAENGGAQTYAVVLQTRPSGDVVVTATSDDTNIARTNGAASATARVLTFTADDWRTPQTVTVTAVDDDLDNERGATIMHEVVSADADYDDIAVASVEIHIIDDDDAPNAPTNLRARAISEVELSLSWNAPAGTNPAITEYVVEYRASGDGAYTDAAHSSTGTTAMVNGLAPRTAYQVRVAAINAIGTGPYASARASTVLDNTPAIHDVILPELARAIVDRANSTIARRVRQRHDSAAGLRLNNATPMAALAAHARALDDQQSVGAQMRSLFGDAAFALPLSDLSERDEWGAATLWGNSAYAELGGDERGVNWSGELMHLELGVDARPAEGMLAGAMLAWSESDVRYAHADRRGDHELRLAALHPYLAWTTDAGADLWASVGYGGGDLTHRPDHAPRIDSDVGLRSAALGGSGEVARVGDGALRIRGEAQGAWLDVEYRGRAYDAHDVEAQRMRLGLAYSDQRVVGDHAWHRTAEAAARYDGGDGRIGSGAEMGFSVRYDAAHRLLVEGRVRALLAHRGDYRDFGVSGLMHYRAGVDGQGLSMRLAPAWGDAQSGVEQLWREHTAALAVAPGADSSQAHARMDSELGYGFAFGDGMLTPYGGLRLADDGRDLRFGGRFTRSNSSLRIDLEAYRQEGAADRAAGLRFNASVNW